MTSDRRAPPHTAFPIVLVHGAWVGEWCWARVARRLVEAGCAVFAVSLTGHGARRAESGPHVTLGDHVADVVAVFVEHDLHDVTLVGHSYGGRVITKAWPHVASRVGKMVYLDAHAPVGDEATTTGAVSWPTDGNGMVPFSGFEREPGRPGTAAEGVLVAQSARTLEEPFREALPVSLDKTYVHAAAEVASPFGGYAAAARDDPAWRYVEVDADHWLLSTHPDEVAAIILDPERAGGS